MAASSMKVIPMAIPASVSCQRIELLKENRAREGKEKHRCGEGEEEEEEKGLSYECRDLLDSLPREKGWRTRYLYQYQGFWCQAKEIQSIISFQKHFKSVNNDIILATIPKSGTTWLKALTFALVNRHQFPVSSSDHPLLTSNPHDLVPFFEYKLYANDSDIPDLSHIPSPRTFATHVPFGSLKDSIKSSNVKVVYLCRNPFDTFVSSWHYVNNIKSESMSPVSLDEGFDLYCRGVIGFGPFWEHMLGYWKESLERPDRMLFLQYEDMKEDIVSNLTKLANFLGFPFSKEEQQQGVIQRIAKLCSFDSLKSLEVNKSSKSIKNFENRFLFRKGQVSDWRNYLRPSQAERLSKLMDEKLAGSGLTFKCI
ncbi:PREDICTED: cytosolic sulfotransferase 15-like [Tarenaya hassleriana]|uniref:cytosolic sulfotransferase 15-like n=1 Tax=Tarenaya hassleriana TaxID=28532 RepID=UPI00053C63EE|nr:PREDICTED: cytosolic sulfotransferase 15-like [Tarenaya hassleriana]